MTVSSNCHIKTQQGVQVFSAELLITTLSPDTLVLHDFPVMHVAFYEVRSSSSKTLLTPGIATPSFAEQVWSPTTVNERNEVDRYWREILSSKFSVLTELRTSPVMVIRICAHEERSTPGD